MVTALAGQSAEPEPRSDAEDQGATRAYPIPQLQSPAEPVTKLHPRPQLQSPPEAEPKARPLPCRSEFYEDCSGEVRHPEPFGLEPAGPGCEAQTEVVPRHLASPAPFGFTGMRRE